MSAEVVDKPAKDDDFVDISVDIEKIKNSIPEGAMGEPIKGPSALSGDFRRFMHLTWVVASTDFKLKFFGSVLGYLWQLMRPLMLFGILFIVFTQFIKLGDKVAFYPAILLGGIVIYSFFSEATSGAVTAVIARENLVRKVRFPRLVVPLATVLMALMNMMLNFIAVFVFMMIVGVEPHLGWLLFPVLILALALFTSGIAALVSALYVRYRDVQPIWDVVLQAFFYATPILYTVEVLPNETVKRLIMFNPVATILEQFRHWIIDPNAPDAATVMGGTVWLLVPFSIAAVVIALGFWVFNREAPKIAEEL